jgi:hypothetical protein
VRVPELQGSLNTEARGPPDPPLPLYCNESSAQTIRANGGSEAAELACCCTCNRGDPPSERACTAAPILHDAVLLHVSQWRRNETVVEKNVPKRQPGNQHSRPPSPLRTPDNVQVAAGVWHHQVILSWIFRRRRGARRGSCGPFDRDTTRGAFSLPHSLRVFCPDSAH